LELTYTVTIDNPHYGKTEDVEIAKTVQQFGQDKVVVLQEGRDLGGTPYAGCTDMWLSIGGYEGDRTSIIHPRDRQLDMGWWCINDANAYYCRGLIRFKLAALNGKRIKQAWLKFSIRPGQNYQPAEMKGAMPVYPLLKEWKEAPKTTWVDERKMGVGLPNVHYHAFPAKWEKPLASGASDRGPEMAVLEGEKGVNLLHGAKADVTKLVQDMAAGKLPNYGFLIGKDLPEELAQDHPKKHMDAYKKLYEHGSIPFFSKDEPDDKDFRPRLIVVLE